jgi:hypothetical protein
MENQTQSRYKRSPCYHAQVKLTRETSNHTVCILISYEGCQKPGFSTRGCCYAPLSYFSSHHTVGFLSSVHLPLGMEKEDDGFRLTDEGGVEVIFKLFF